MTTLPKLYASEAEVADMLDLDVKWLRANAEVLEAQFSFPKKDIAIGKRHVPSIVEWAAERNGRRKPQNRQTGGSNDGF